MIEIEIDRAKNVPGIYACYLRFLKYNEEWINIIRQFNCRKYDSDSKTWEFPFYNLSDIVNRYPNVPIKIHYKKQDGQQNFVSVPELGLKLPLFNHQKIAVEYGVNNPKYLLLDTMGLGKTASVIAEAIALKKLGKIRQCLIICCVSDLQYNWEEEISKFSDEQSFILGSRYRKNGKRYAGSVSDRIEDLKTHKEFFLITNSESLLNETFVDLIRNKYKKTPTTIDLLAIDEVHKKCGNPSNSMGKNLQKLCDIPYIIPMTGTLIRNRPFDAWAPLKLIGKENSNYSQFCNYYGVYGGYEGYQVISYKNLDNLQSQLSQCSLRRTKDDVLDLPPKIFENVYVTMNDRQKLIYNEAYNLALENIDKITESPNPLAQLIRLRQATDYTGILSSTVEESAKIDQLVEDVCELTENGEKIIVYSNWSQVVNEIELRLKSKHLNVLKVTGESISSGDELEDIKHKFQTNDDYKVIIGTTGKLGTGHTLTAASWIMFVDEPWTKADKDQAVDRAHRPGQTKTINIKTYITKDTIDEKVHAIVQGKGDVADYIVDGKIVDKKNLVKYLLSISD